MDNLKKSLATKLCCLTNILFVFESLCSQKQIEF